MIGLFNSSFILHPSSFVLFFILNATAWAAALPRFTITDLGVLPNTAHNLGPVIDAQGRIAAWGTIGSSGEIHARLWIDGKPFDLGALPDFPNTFATAINAQGQIVGLAQAQQDSRFCRAFLWDNGRMSDLGALQGRYSTARAINAQGEIAGGVNTATGKIHACLWHEGKARDLGTLPGGDYSLAYALNGAGEIVGIANISPNGSDHPFLWQNGTLQDLGLMPGGHFGAAHTINDRGQVAGWADTADGETHAFLWDHGARQDLGSLGDTPSAAWCINNHSQIVGNSATSRKWTHAFLWENGRMSDLNDQIAPNSGWSLRFATGINDRGQIVGRGIYRGASHLFLLTPATAFTPRRLGAALKCRSITRNPPMRIAFSPLRLRGGAGGGAVRAGGFCVLERRFDADEQDQSKFDTRHPTPDTLNVEPQPGVDRPSPSVGKMDLGEIDTLKSPMREHTFRLRNMGRTNLTIAYIQSSCGCATAVLPPGKNGSGDPNARPLVKPGEEVALRVTLNASHLRPGSFEKYLYVYVEGETKPAATLELTGRLPILVAFSPSVLDFGCVPAGQTRQLFLKADLDARVLDHGRPPELWCSNPDIRIQLLPAEKPASAGAQRFIQIYSLTLAPDACLGLIAARIEYRAEGRGLRAEDRSVPQPSALDPQPYPTVPVSGEVIGDITPVPYVVVFGSLHEGQETIRQVKLTGRTSEALRNITISCSIPSLSARLLPAEGAAGPASGASPAPASILEVRLGANTPPGGLQAEVRIRTYNGQRLVLPVIGDVISGQQR